MREMGPHSQGDSRRLYRWRDIASNTRGRISDLAAPLATLLRKRLQLHTAGMRPRQEVAIGAGPTISLPFMCSPSPILHNLTFGTHWYATNKPRQLNTRFAGCG